MTVSLRPATLAEVRALPGASAATRENVSLTPTRMRVHWRLYIVEGEVVGFGSWCEPRQGTARLKGLYVFPAHRGRGYSAEAITLLLAEIRQSTSATLVDQFAAAPDWWLRRGWRPLGRRARNGTQRIGKTI